VLRLTLLAPDIIEAILSGRPPAGLQIEDLLKRFPVGRKKQRAEMLCPTLAGAKPKAIGASCR